MVIKHGWRSPRRSCWVWGLFIGLTIIAGTAPGAGQSPTNVRSDVVESDAQSRTGEYATALDYVVQFYPLWFTYYQSLAASHNRLVGPVRISPLYHIVVAINDDTLYASTFLYLHRQPVIVTVPGTKLVYSVLTLDRYGNVIATDIQPSTTAKTYGLMGPGFKGTLPAGVIPVALPVDFPQLIFRVDKHTPEGRDVTAQADLYRRSLQTQPLCAYVGKRCPDDLPRGGKTLILPETAFSEPFKTAADFLITHEPIRFLEQLQTAVLSSFTPPFSPAQHTLSDRFDRLFHNGHLDAEERLEFTKGARAAHGLILNRYLNHTGPTNWIHFTNIGDWGNHVFERSSISEFIQYGNDIGAAAYYHTFEDNNGRALDGTALRGYVLTFRKRQIPEAERFWSLTAYTPEAIQLVPNSANKYVVASYTKNLHVERDGSVTVFLARTRPLDKPKANWLPIPSGPFNIMLRVYGPEGRVANDTYLPPSIKRRS